WENMLMSARYRLRGASAAPAAGLCGAIGIIALVMQVWQGGWGYLPPAAVFAAGMCLAGYALFYLPSVDVDGSGVTIRNTFRDLRVPFPRLRGVESGYGLVITTTDGAAIHARAFGSVGRPTPDTRRAVPVHDSGDHTVTTATLPVRKFIESVASRYVPAGAPSEHPRVERHWAWDRLAFAVAGVLGVLGGIAWSVAL
ncbi:PH domain-containing protein, partial [Actinotignum timonense]